MDAYWLFSAHCAAALAKKYFGPSSQKGTRRDGRFLRSKEGLPPFLSFILCWPNHNIAAPLTQDSSSPQHEQSDLVLKTDQIKPTAIF